VPAPSALKPLVRLALPLLLSASAHGQWAGRIAAETDHRFRGVSLSGEDPTLSVSLAYDHPSGWYAGASLTRVELEPGSHGAATTLYAGYARRRDEGLAYEGGATLTHFGGDAEQDYGELYGGLIAERWSARLYVSPRYLGRDVRTLYAEVNAAVPLTLAWRAFAHAGALVRLAGEAPADAARTRFDARAGLGYRVNAWDLQASAVSASRGGVYTATYAQRHSTVILTATIDF
jgi:uncharacterized protein (TIGR02001 family)